jgi:hypothetical protein
MYSLPSAEIIAKGLDGRKRGNGWIVRCPAHDDREPSLSIRDGSDGGLLFQRFAGCGQGRVISALRSRGLWGEKVHHEFRFTRPASRGVVNDRPKDNTKRSEAALAIRQSAIRAAETLVETDLNSRDLGLPPPLSLRFHAGLRRPSGGVWPTMVAPRGLLDRRAAA